LTRRSDPCNIKYHWWGDGAAAFHSNPLLDTLSASRDRAILGSGRVAALDLLYQYSRDQRVIFTSASIPWSTCLQWRRPRAAMTIFG